MAGGTKPTKRHTKRHSWGANQVIVIIRNDGDLVPPVPPVPPSLQSYYYGIKKHPALRRGYYFWEVHMCRFSFFSQL